MESITAAVGQSDTLWLWILGAAGGIGFAPLLIIKMLKVLQGFRAEMSVTDLAQTQGGIYKDAVLHNKQIIEELKTSRDAAEKRNADLMVKLANLSDQVVGMHKVVAEQGQRLQDQEHLLERQTDQLALQSRQMVSQSEKLEAAEKSLAAAEKTIAAAERTIAMLTEKINTLEERSHGSVA